MGKWKRLNFNHANKYLHKPEFVLENETHKILWGHLFLHIISLNYYYAINESDLF